MLLRLIENTLQNKQEGDIGPLFRDAKEIAGKKPNVLICDGMPTFNQAYLKELFIEEPNNNDVKTSAEVCGIYIKDMNKQLTIIHNASPICAYHNENNAKETSGRGSTL